MLPSASAARNTALPDPSDDLVRMAVATAPWSSPSVEALLRLVPSPEKMPPATASGAPASGAPLGSRTVIVPGPSAPVGALATQGRPLPLLIEMPSGRLDDTNAAVTAIGLLMLLRKAASPLA